MVTEIILPAVGNEPESRTGMSLNCAARLGPNLDRECKRMARKGDYCLQHWQMNYGHNFDSLTLECGCGVKWNEEGASEVCDAKVTYVEFHKAPEASNG
jgi:hypothetical protein